MSSFINSFQIRWDVKLALLTGADSGGIGCIDQCVDEGGAESLSRGKTFGYSCFWNHIREPSEHATHDPE